MGSAEWQLCWCTLLTLPVTWSASSQCLVCASAPAPLLSTCLLLPSCNAAFPVVNTASPRWLTCWTACAGHQQCYGAQAVCTMHLPDCTCNPFTGGAAANKNNLQQERTARCARRLWSACAAWRSKIHLGSCHLPSASNAAQRTRPCEGHLQMHCKAHRASCYLAFTTKALC